MLNVPKSYIWENLSLNFYNYSAYLERMDRMKETFVRHWVGFPGGAMVKNPPANVGEIRDTGSISGSGRSSVVVNGNPLQNSCLEASSDRGA